MSSFVSHITHDLSLRIAQPTSSGTPSSPREQPAKESLRGILLQVNQAASLRDVAKCLEDFRNNDHAQVSPFAESDEEEDTLKRAVVGKLAVDLYGRALDAYLEEARQIEDELDWWSYTERSNSNVALYLLQTLPLRIKNATQTIVSTLRIRNLPLRPSLFTPTSLARLFPSRGILKPNKLMIAFFPHLQEQPYSIAFTAGRLPSPSAFAAAPAQGVRSALSAFKQTLIGIARCSVQVVASPLDLTRAECRYKLQELKKLRDQRAEILGTIAEMRDLLASALEDVSPEEGMAKLAAFTYSLQCIIQGEDINYGVVANQSTVDSLQVIAFVLLPENAAVRTSELHIRNLARPSRLTLLWPRLVLLPPLALYTVRLLYASRDTWHQMAIDAWETARGFWEGWLLEPLRGVIKTVRAGGEDSVIITRESVKADLDSLERMALALAQEKLHYDPAQMAALSQQIQLGDLTPVMQIYEDDIKSPLKSAVSGTLLRTLFIQVQKTKVDINQALAGIDKLLKSQELTFAFVGVAPALAIVYAVGGYLRRLWTGSQGRYGGKKRKASVWLKMRRIERLLISQPRSHHTHTRNPTSTSQHPSTATSIPPLTSGLLLLSVSHLRAYAEQHLPVHSRLQESFLEDVVDLEDPALGRAEKLRVLDRMWRSWGGALGWEKVVGGVGGR